MPREEPSWWYGDRGHVVRLLLQPLGQVYGAIARRRLKQPATVHAQVPVICIGNFTAGGTGKTPLAIWLARTLSDAGQQPVFLSRGYGGSRPGPHLVVPGSDTAAEVGDEPLLLAACAPTVIARDRAAGARLIEERSLGTVIIMDDGLQNPTLAKDLTIAVVDARRGIGNGLVIPAGPLRAPLADQRAITDVIVVNEGSPHSPHVGNAAVMSLLADFRGTIVSVCTAPAADLACLGDKPVLAFAGIANPDRFFDLLRSLGADIREARSFRDHHTFTERDATALIADAEQSGCQLVTTEKDFVRLGHGSAALLRLKAISKVLPIRLTANDENMAAMQRILLDAVQARTTPVR